MPAAKFRPVLPSTATQPPVMYSQPWSPTPSTTATAPELRTAEALACLAADIGLAAGRAVERYVADDDVLDRADSARLSGGYTVSLPPESPLPK